MGVSDTLTVERRESARRGEIRDGRWRELLRDVWRAKYLYLALSPTFILLAVLAYYPVLEALYRAFFQWNGYSKAKWVGVGHFVAMADDEVLVGSVGNMFKLTLFSIIVGNAVAIAVAELIFHLKRDRLQQFMRLGFIIPMVVPAVTTTLIWRSFMDPSYGVLNELLKLVGLPPQSWLGDFQLALPSLMLMGFPWVSGFSLLIYSAGLMNISQEIIDAAAVDGATGLARILRIDLPLLLGQVRLLVVMGIIGGIQAFQSILILTKGGPGNATMVPAMHLYMQGFNYTKMGYACAIGLVLFVIIMILTYINMKYVRPATEYEGRNV